MYCTAGTTGDYPTFARDVDLHTFASSSVKNINGSPRRKPPIPCGQDMSEIMDEMFSHDTPKHFGKWQGSLRSQNENDYCEIPGDETQWHLVQRIVESDTVKNVIEKLKVKREQISAHTKNWKRTLKESVVAAVNTVQRDDTNTQSAKPWNDEHWHSYNHNNHSDDTSLIEYNTFYVQRYSSSSDTLANESPVVYRVRNGDAICSSIAADTDKTEKAEDINELAPGLRFYFTASNSKIQNGFDFILSRLLRVRQRMRDQTIQAYIEAYRHIDKRFLYEVFQDCEKGSVNKLAALLVRCGQFLSQTPMPDLTWLYLTEIGVILRRPVDQDEFYTLLLNNGPYTKIIYETIRYIRSDKFEVDVKTEVKGKNLFKDLFKSTDSPVRDVKSDLTESIKELILSRYMTSV